jgi:hypothetical protein
MYKKIFKFSTLYIVSAVCFFLSATTAFANDPAPTIKIRPGDSAKTIPDSSGYRWYNKGEKVYIHLREVGNNSGTVEADVRYDKNKDFQTYNSVVATYKLKHGAIKTYFIAPYSGYYYGFLSCNDKNYRCSENFDMDDAD